MDNSLNSIQLSDSMLAAFYERSLVEIADKKVLVVLKTELAKEENLFLWQILGACKLEQSDVTIVNISVKKTAIEKVVADLQPKHIISFGAGSGTELFSMGNDQGTRYLNAPGLEEMMQDNDTSRQLKRKTWNELKTIFGI